MKQEWEGDVVYGVAPVLAALQSNRRTIHTLYVQEGLQNVESERGSGSGGGSGGKERRKEGGAVPKAMSLAQQCGGQVRTASKHDLNMMCNNRPHQGMVLDASALDFEALTHMPIASAIASAENDDNSAPPVWLCLDEVTDPQNFGAALRSAFFLGAAGVVTCRRNSSPLTGVVSKASAGAMEAMTVYSCRSMPQFLGDARERGWTVVGAAVQADAVSCNEYTPRGPTLLVMGNEGHGLRTTVRQQCDGFLRIDRVSSSSSFGGGGMVVDSLNVSVATGILLHQLLLGSRVVVT